MKMKMSVASALAISVMVTACAPEAVDHTFPPRGYSCTDPGAGDSCTTDNPVRTDESRTVQLPRTFEDRTATYVVNLITVPEAIAGAGGRRNAAGFNLDGLDTMQAAASPDTCLVASEDFASSSDSDVVGVDNALQSFIPAIESLLDAAACPGGTTDGCLDATLLRQMAEGDLILMLEVSGINDFGFDDSVSVQLLLGTLPDGATPALDSDGRLSSGQAFETDVSPDGTPLLLGPAYEGDIFGGRLRITADRLVLSLDTGDRQLDLTIVNAEIRFDIQEGGLTNGMIGGALPIADIVAAADMTIDGGGDLVRPVVEGAADIDPSAEDPTQCSSASLGIAFEATVAELQR